MDEAKTHPKRQKRVKASPVPPVDWTQPVMVKDVDLAFPACVIGRLLPHAEDIPSTFKDDHTSPWKNLASEWFYRGLHGHFTPKSGIDPKAAGRQLQACLGSFEPKHEHKLLGVAYLMSLFFTEFVQGEPDGQT